MAFKRSTFKTLVKKDKVYFSSKYKLSKKVKDWKKDSECYIIMLGLEDGYYETPTHTIQPHKVDKQTIGFISGVPYSVTIKCKGIDEDGNRSESLCCKLAQMETDREAKYRCINYTSNRVHIPVLILGNSLKEDKPSYPVTKVSILNSLHSEAGLNFAYIDMASSTFTNDVINAYGKKLKEDGVLDYEADETSEEYLEDIRKRLTRTVVKVKAVEKASFKGTLREYSFFPFENPSIASQSPEGEREAIINYKKNKEIMEKIDEFLTLFNVEVDHIYPEWSEKDLQEYYNSFIGADLKTPLGQEVKKETIEEIDQPFVDASEIDELTEEDKALLDDETEDEIKETPVKVQEKQEVSAKKEEWEIEETKEEETSSEDFEFDLEDEEGFFED